MIEKLTHLLSYRVWAIDETFAERVVPIILHQLKSGNYALDSFRQSSATKIQGRYNGLEAQQIGKQVSVLQVKTKSGQQVAIIPIVGSLTKRGDLCAYGMRDYSSEILRLNQNEDISAIVLDIESPGGTVDGTAEFGLAVKQSKKPIVAYGDGMVASAAYWVASQARFIMANKNNPTEFGSIGTLYIHENYSKYIEQNIGEINIIRAPQSVDKALVNPFEQLRPDVREGIEADLKQITKEFIATVKKGRGERLDANAPVFTGKMFKATEALKHGLIDGMGTLADAVNKAAELASGKSSFKSNYNATMNVKKAVSSFFTNKKATQAAEEEPSAADAVPMWTEDMIFNTDGSGDGAFCMHPDSEGNDRKFETKTDGNQGNEPPTDPTVTEDDNWNLVPVAEEVPEQTEAKSPQPTSSVEKLNVALKKSKAEAQMQAAKVKQLSAEITTLKEKLAAAPAGTATTVVTKQDKGPEYKEEKEMESWEKKAQQKVSKLNKV